MIRKYTCVFCFMLMIFASAMLNAQIESKKIKGIPLEYLNGFSVSANGGSMLAFGDIKQYSFLPASNKENKFGGGFAITKSFKSIYAIRAQFLFGGLGGQEKNATPPVYYKTSLVGYSVHGLFNINELIWGQTKPNKLSVYAIVGFGYASYRAFQKNLTTDTYVKSVGYKNYKLDKAKKTTDVVIPVGLGIKYKINENFDINFETIFHYALSDKLDAQFVKGDNSNDKYLYTNIGITYKFNFPDPASKINEGYKGQELSGPFDKYKRAIAAANTRFKVEDYGAAQRMYRELYKDHADDALLNLRLGKAQVMMKNMDQGIESLEKAQKLLPTIDPEVHLYLGKAHQYLGRLDKAIAEYQKYIASLIKQKDRNDNPAIGYLAQVKTAKELMSKPVDVKITNMGEVINSQYTDAAPCITGDRKTFLFTSRRPDTQGGGVDYNTGNYFDDIYISEFDEKTKTWSSAVSAEGLNSPGFDASMSISPDGMNVLIYRNMPGVTKSGDIYTSKMGANGKWSAPKPLPEPINSSFFEGSACYTPDGKTIYFVSERKGGHGNADIWKSTQISAEEWSKPENLGPVINSVEDEISVFLHPDGKTLFFASRGHNSMGGLDIFMSTLDTAKKWSKPINLGYPINTTKDEIHFTLTADGRKAYISSTREEGLGDVDIYEINMRDYKVPNVAQNMDVSAFTNKLSIISGNVLVGANKLANAKIVIVNTKTKQEVASLLSGETGDYFITLPGNTEYELRITKEGYQELVEKVNLPYTLEKIFNQKKDLNLIKK